MDIVFIIMQMKPFCTFQRFSFFYLQPHFCARLYESRMISDTVKRVLRKRLFDRPVRKITENIAEEMYECARGRYNMCFLS